MFLQPDAQVHWCVFLGWRNGEGRRLTAHAADTLIEGLIVADLVCELCLWLLGAVCHPRAADAPSVISPCAICYLSQTT